MRPLAGYDEEMERELWASLLHHSSVRSLQAIGVLTQEREMLAVMLRRADDDVDAAQREAEGVALPSSRLIGASCCVVWA